MSFRVLTFCVTANETLAQMRAIKAQYPNQSLGELEENPIFDLLLPEEVEIEDESELCSEGLLLDIRECCELLAPLWPAEVQDEVWRFWQYLFPWPFMPWPMTADSNPNPQVCLALDDFGVPGYILMPAGIKELLGSTAFIEFIRTDYAARRDLYLQGKSESEAAMICKLMEGYALFFWLLDKLITWLERAQRERKSLLTFFLY